ncbi:MAG: enoyl-CoA hydratase [Deltaproteobacteria bacterium]|nr:enoyl-CoA hydratase [Deltaproteobacteria bacterium]
MNRDVLLVERRDGVATVTLNRPGKLNSLSRQLRDAFVQTLAALADDDTVDVVILTGTGRAFCAGLDLKELGGESATPGSQDDDRERENVVAGADVVRAVENFPGPVIGAINGFAITGGFELALACDVLLASSQARFADTHARVGILPGWGLSQKLSRTIGIYRAKELSLSGNYLSAEQALEWGLVSRVVAPEQLLDTARALAHDMRSCPRDVVRAYKRLIDEGYETDLGHALALENEHSRAHMRSVSSEQIRARRAAVQERGREQT